MSQNIVEKALVVHHKSGNIKRPKESSKPVKKLVLGDSVIYSGDVLTKRYKYK